MGLFHKLVLGRENYSSQFSKRAHCFVSNTDLKMRYVAAYLLAVLGGNETPSSKDLKTILESVGVSFDDERANIVVKQLAGKSVAELIEEGSKKMASMPGGGGPASSGGAAAAAGGDAPAEKKEEKKEETEE